jgi:hypothetical protein
VKLEAMRRISSKTEKTQKTIIKIKQTIPSESINFSYECLSMKYGILSSQEQRVKR